MSDAYVDLGDGFGFGPLKEIKMRVSVDNLFDREPNRVGAGPTTNGAGSTFAGYYDVLGRRYYASARLSF